MGKGGMGKKRLCCYSQHCFILSANLKETRVPCCSAERILVLEKGFQEMAIHVGAILGLPSRGRLEPLFPLGRWTN